MSNPETKIKTPVIVTEETEELFKRMHPDYMGVFDYFVNEGLIIVSED